MRSPGSPRSRTLRSSLAILGIAGALVLACKEGRAPYEVVPSQGSPDQFLPPGGVALGTTRETKQLYRFDRTKYRLFLPLSTTPPNLVRRDSILALASAAIPGAPLSLLERPDLSDPTLARVYADPRLFGFVAASPSDADVFVDGARVSNAYEFLPAQPGNWWELNHNQREWIFVDSIGGSVSPPTAGGRPVVRMIETATARPDLGFAYFHPASYRANIAITSAPGHGIQYHAWTLIAERVVPPELRGGPRGQPDRQRNPRGLWLSISSIPNFSGDPQAPVPVTIDQCLDDLPSELEMFPFQLCTDDIQVGDIFTTWTYLNVPDDALRLRLNEEALVERGGRCGTEVVVGVDTLRMFPTRTFRLLVKFQAQVQYLVDQVELKIGAQTIGKYPKTASPNRIVKFVVTMNLGGGSGDEVAQFLESYYQRGIGEVIRTMGVDPIRRSNARLRSCTVNGTYYPPSGNPEFEYSD